jgi:hypothetical protein
MLILLAATLWYHLAGAQQGGSLHVQSENNQPFYVQWNGEIFPSSASGYLVVPQIPAGDYTIVIGFPKNQYPEYAYKCTVSDRPIGFSLKLAVDNSWNLFDMVSLTTIKGRLATPDEKALLKPLTEKKTIENTLANVQDSAAEKKGDTGIQKIFDQTTEAGTDQIYVVNNDGKMDTVVVLISFLPETGSSAAATRQLLVPQPQPQQKRGLVILTGREIRLPVITKMSAPAVFSK